MNTDGTVFNTCKECHKTRSLWNHTTIDHKEGEQLEDWRNVGESGCNFGDGKDQRVQSLMFMMMMMIIWCCAASAMLSSSPQNISPIALAWMTAPVTAMFGPRFSSHSHGAELLFHVFNALCGIVEMGHWSSFENFWALCLCGHVTLLVLGMLLHIPCWKMGGELYKKWEKWKYATESRHLEFMSD